MCLGRRLYLGNKLRIHPLQPLPLYGAHLPSDGFISFIFLFRRCSSGCVHMLAAAGPTAKLFTERPLVASDARRVADVCCVTACWGIFAICECAVRLELLGSNSVRADQPEQCVLLPGEKNTVFAVTCVKYMQSTARDCTLFFILFCFFLLDL